MFRITYYVIAWKNPGFSISMRAVHVYSYSDSYNYWKLQEVAHRAPKLPSLFLSRSLCLPSSEIKTYSETKGVVPEKSHLLTTFGVTADKWRKKMLPTVKASGNSINLDILFDDIFIDWLMQYVKDLTQLLQN